MATLLKGWKKGMGGKLSRSGNSPVTYNETRTAVVISDIKDESPFNVLSTTGLPRVGLSTLITPTAAICTSVDPKQDSVSPFVWFVDCEFSTATDKQDTNDSNPDPTTWLPIYSGKIETYPEVMHTDFSTPPKPYLNSAKCKFPEPLIINRPIIVYDFFQYEADTITDIQIGDRNDTINSDTVRGGMFPISTLKCTVSGFERGYFYGMAAVKINYSVAYKKSTWLNKPLDMGYDYLIGSNKLTSDSIVALNSDGTKKADTADPDALEFKGFRPISFSFLR